MRNPSQTWIIGRETRNEKRRSGCTQSQENQSSWNLSWIVAPQVGPGEGGIGPKRQKRRRQIENVEQEMARILFQKAVIERSQSCVIADTNDTRGVVADDEDEANWGPEPCFNRRRSDTTPVTRVKEASSLAAADQNCIASERVAVVAVHLQGPEESTAMPVLLQQHLISLNYNIP